VLQRFAGARRRVMQTVSFDNSMIDQLSTEYPGHQGKPGIVALAYFALGKMGLALPCLDNHILRF
jgi:hypothetical protein